MHELIHHYLAGYPAAEAWLHGMYEDLFRYVVFAVGVWLVLWVGLAGPLKGRKIRPDRPPARQLLMEFLISVRSIAIFSTIGLTTMMLDRAGWLPGEALARSWGPGWFVACLALMIVAHDAYFYWVHRLIHDPRLFRMFHRRHHRSMNPSPFTAYSFDLGEAAAMAAFVPLWMVIVPTQWEVTGLFMLHQIVRNTMGHAGYELMPASRAGRPLFDWMTTTTHHDLHHAQAGYNYGLYFTWWDRWMGTEHPEYLAKFAAAVRKPAPAGRGRSTIAAASALLVAGVMAAGEARAQEPASIGGDWATPGLGLVVRIGPCGEAAETACGRIIWAWDPGALRPGSVGGVILSDARWREGAFRDGSLLSPEDGRTYKGEIRTDGPDRLRLKGCAGPFCQTQVWRRLSSIPRP